MAKDLFSQQSKLYSQYRPTYPKELFDYITSLVEEKNVAWDCATGNGQAADILSGYFKKVIATDISNNQIQNAIQKDNIEYLVCPAEKTPFAENTFDLITVAQAYHWLNWPHFHTEAYRVGKNNAIVAIWNYNLLVSNNKKITEVLHRFYVDVTGPYWEPERKFVDDNYATAQFDFAPLPPKQFTTELQWKKSNLIGYINTWSAVQQYMKVHRSSPIEFIQPELDKLLHNEAEFHVQFPIHLRIGRIIK